MKKIFAIMILLVLSLCTTTMSRNGVRLDGMQFDEVLKTDYIDSTKVHTLVVESSVSQSYEDRVLLFKFLHMNGDSTVIDATGNYSDNSLGKTAFIIKPKAGEVMMISRMIVSYSDDGAFDSGTYGNNIVLTNGITSYFRRYGVDVYAGLDPNLPITKNTGWAGLCYDVRVDDFGQGEVQLSSRFTFFATGKYIRLDGDLGDEYVLYFHDDFSGLNSHRFLMQGYYEKGPI